MSFYVKRGIWMFSVAAVLSAVFSIAAQAASTALYTPFCSETDGGLDYPYLGFTTDKWGKHTDECLDSKNLVEWYCSSGVARNTTHMCPSGCLDGECVGGDPNSVRHVLECTDTDGGRVYDVLGTVNGKKEDKCISTTRLREWYCKGNTAKSTTYICPNGCSDGVCKGNVTVKFSWVPLQWHTTVAASTTTTTHPDAAETTSTTSTTASTTTTAKAQPECSDSDGGRVFFVSGVTRVTHAEWRDKCIGNSKRLQEWYCSNGKARSAYTICAKGCRDGACR